jgi:peptide/nickel transport system permease protein
MLAAAKRLPALERLPAAVELALTAPLNAVAVAVPAGIMGAQKRNSAADIVTRTFALVGQSAPVYRLGIMLILVFFVQLNWSPTGGTGPNHFRLPCWPSIYSAVACATR